MPTRTISTCSNCGHSAPSISNFCPNCGLNLSHISEPVINISQNTVRLENSQEKPTPQEQNLGLACHLATLAGWIIPFSDLVITAVIYSMNKDTSLFVRHHAREALNYQITFYICTIIAVVLSWVLIGIPLLILLALVDVTLPLFMAIKASNGETRAYPFILRII